MKLSLLAPDKSVFDGEVTRVLVNAAEGLIDIYPGHAGFVSYLLPGFVTFGTPQGESCSFFAPGGYIEVKSDNIHVLGDFLLAKTELTPELLNGFITAAKDELAKTPASDTDKIELLGQKIAAFTNVLAYSV